MGIEAAARPRTVYGLSWNPRPSLLLPYAAFSIVLTLSSVGISYLAVSSLPAPAPIGAFYFASIFYALTTYWFGGWGLLSAYVGSVIGAGTLQALPLPAAMTFSIANVIEPLVPFLLIRTVGQRIGIDPLCASLTRKPHHMVMFLLFGASLPPLLSGLWGVSVLILMTPLSADEFRTALGGWWIGATILLAIGVPLAGRILGPFLGQKDIACRGLWS